MDSIWQETVELPRFQPLETDIKTDVLVIGGGLAGILCAYHLDRAGIDYVLVEADRICSGITKNTTAKITSQHGLIYHKIQKRYGDDAAGLYLEANERAVMQYRKLCELIDCDFKLLPNYVYSLDDRQALEREMKTLDRIGFPAMFAEHLSLPVSTVGAVGFPRQAQFHPLKFIGALSEHLRIYEQTKVRHLRQGHAVTDQGTITAEKIIVTTHFPLLNKHGLYFMKLYQERSYVLALERAKQVHGMYVDENEKGLSFRDYGQFLLLGGGSHRTGKKGGNWRELSDFAGRHYPEHREIARWATQDCMTLDGIPYIGQYSKTMPNLFVATGFQKWGMTSAMVAANILTDLVHGKENPYAAVYSPSRSMMHPQLLINGMESTLNLLTPTVPRCPHMGCALKYNPDEHSWDCPCHGSRFTRQGKLIDNPATDDKKR